MIHGKFIDPVAKKITAKLCYHECRQYKGLQHLMEGKDQLSLGGLYVENIQEKVYGE